MPRLPILIVVLIAGALLAWRGQTPPDPVPIEAVDTVFSAERAMWDVRAIGAKPHPVGSPAQAMVRDHLMARMSALGLTPHLQRAAAIEITPGKVEGGWVENVVGILPGDHPTRPAVLLMAHYDAVRGSPGAADDAAGVAAALEIVRALKARGPRARDVIVLFTDGEEAGLLGARAFVAEHPWADRVGFVINLEARGSSGRALMFETGPRNGETIRLFAADAKRPVSNSFLVFAYEIMPNSTDFTPFKQKGVQGLNFAFLGREFDYHSPSATPERLDLRSLQDLGAQGLAAARAVAVAETLPKAAPDAAYGEAAGRWLVRYPPQAGWLVIALTGLALAVGAWRARNRLRWRDAALGVLLALAAPAAAGLGAMVMRAHFVAETEWLAKAPLIEAGLIAVGLGLILLAAVLGGLKGRREGAWAGAMTTALAALVAVQLAAPAAAPLIAWPVALVALGAAVTALGSDERPAAVLIHAMLAIAALAITGAIAHLVFLALGADTPVALAGPAWLALLILLPLAWPRAEKARAWVAAGPLGVGLLVCVAAVFLPPYSKARALPAQVVYVTDVSSGESWRASPNRRRPPWVADALQADGGTPSERAFPPLYPFEVAAAPAAPVPANPLALELTQDGEGIVTLLVRPSAPGLMNLELKSSAPVTRARVAGLAAPVLAAPGRWSHVEWHSGALAVSFRPSAAGTLDIRYADARAGWPLQARPLAAPPAEILPAGLHGSHVVMGGAKFSFAASAGP